MILKTILEAAAIILLLTGFCYEPQIAEWENKMLSKLFGGDEE